LLDTLVRTLRMIVGALLVGALTFAGIVIFVISPGGGNPPSGWLVTLVGAVFALLMIAVRFILPEAYARSAVARVARGETTMTDEQAAALADTGVIGQLLAIYQTGTIIAAAPLEGASFFNLIAYLIEGQWPSLAIAGVLIALMAALFPTRERVLAWIETQQRRFGNPGSA
jgi:hypothetical protein